MSERDHLAAMLAALDASSIALHRPVCRGWIGDWQITGKTGHILSDGGGYLLYANTPEKDEPHPEHPDRKLCYGSARKWTNIKSSLAFARLTQDGDDEGCFYLDRLPTQAEAEAIRSALGIRKRRNMTAEALSNLERARGSIKSPNLAPDIAPETEEAGIMGQAPRMPIKASKTLDQIGTQDRPGLGNTRGGPCRLW